MTTIPLRQHLKYHTVAGIIMIALGAVITNYYLVTGGAGYTLSSLTLALIIYIGHLET